MQKIEGTLASRYSVEYVIREFSTIVNNLAQDSPAKVFKLVENANVEHETLYLPYTPIRAPQQVCGMRITCRLPTFITRSYHMYMVKWSFFVLSIQKKFQKADNI